MNIHRRTRISLSLLGALLAGSLPAQTILNKDLKLLPADGAPDDQFGYAVAISGDYTVVGSRLDDITHFQQGSAYVFDASGNQIRKLTASDAYSNDRFGETVAISGNYAVVGSSYDDDKGFNSGSAYVFDLITGKEMKLTASDGVGGDGFASSVAASGNIVVVGSPGGDGVYANTGAAYVYDITTGVRIRKLSASDGSVNDRFGQSVAVSGNYVVVGSQGDDDKGSSSGSAYVFDLTTGREIKLLPKDGAESDYFGSSVGISGDYAVVGSLNDDDNGSSSGSAYVFNVTTGDQIHKLLPNDGAGGDWFGYSVAVSGTHAVIGARLDGDNGALSGSAYLFDVLSGDQLHKFLPSDGASYGFFGHSVAASGNRAIIGSIGDDDNGSYSGSAYVFEISTGSAVIPEPSGLLVAITGGLLGLLFIRRRPRRDGGRS